MYKSIHSFALRAAAPAKEPGTSPDDIIAHAREEVERAKAERDPSWGVQMLRLCNLLYARYESNLEHKPDSAGASKIAEDLDLEHALDDWRRIATAGLRTVPSPPSVRFRAALKWADVSCREGRYKSAVEAYKVAMSLAPRVSLARRRDAINEEFDMVEAAPGEENELLLNTFSLASDAAAAAIERGQPETAIEFLEQARTLLWRDALGLPCDLDNLELKNPNLARHVTDVLRELEQGHDAFSPNSPIANLNMRAPWMRVSEPKVKNDSSPDDKWNSVVGTVRASESGFHDFLRPWTFDSMRVEGAPVPVGPVVILNASHLRCDAIILVSTNEPLIVPLTRTSRSELERVAARLIKGVKELEESALTGFQFDKVVLEPVLKDLWETVVQPVLSKLDEVALGGGRSVGWVTNGVFTWLPLHAAAIVGDGRSNRAESSEDGTATPKSYSTKYSFYYATTLQSLLHPVVIDNRTESRVLVVSDQPSRRASLLGGNVTSIQALKSQLAPSPSSTPEPQSEPGRRNVHIESLEGPAARPDSILKALQPTPIYFETGEDNASSNGVDVIHFSCPTLCDALRPASSAWRVADGSYVKISDVFDTWFYPSNPHSVKPETTLPDLVFSNAASYRIDGPAMAGSGDVRLPQELMTPEAALQFAGVRGVVGQMWSTKNEDATVVAKHVYQAAVNSGTGEDRRIHSHPITGKILRVGRASFGASSPDASTPVGEEGVPVWETKGVEDALAALRAAHVPLFRTVPFVRYGP
ncbi:hypothetical protein PIIN_10585 [Serendipita indica DSM 11827]|uniref:Uncharacterized protein n=1 Tax=Serendipita indica (strain DSM 11827) TaxID=1109443 RepID=G4TZ51_SERID|nr:hypothetical protein PIIN_10585 [Serendipita indica DSM 11827]